MGRLFLGGYLHGICEWDRVMWWVMVLMVIALLSVGYGNILLMNSTIAFYLLVLVSYLCGYSCL